MRTLQVNLHEIQLEIFHSCLNSWGKENFRIFPWRQTKNSYFILVSEVMLHRTQVKQVEPVFKHFIQKYPNIISLSQATKDDLHDILYPLGLRWRIDLFYEMVKELLIRFGGKIPYKKEELLSLPGISEYIASAVRCFTWDLPEPLLDTNTVGVAGRLFGLKIKDSSRRSRQFKKLLRDLLDNNNPRIYNYSLLDLADKVCTRRTIPDCNNCPILKLCKHGNEISTNTGIHINNGF